jgi:hypothetical protein
MAVLNVALVLPPHLADDGEPELIIEPLTPEEEAEPSLVLQALTEEEIAARAGPGPQARRPRPAGPAASGETAATAE